MKKGGQIVSPFDIMVLVGIIICKEIKKEDEMKKRTVSKILAGIMACVLLSGCGGAAGGASTKQPEGAAANEGVYRFGVLSYLNMGEEDMAAILESRRPAIDYLKSKGIAKTSFSDNSGVIKIEFFDTLDSIVMALEAGEIEATELPKCTADYLTAHNDKLSVQLSYNLDKADEYDKALVNSRGVGFSFMMMESKKALCDEFDKALGEMKSDGTLGKLVKDYINDGVFTEQKAVEFTKTSGDTVKIAVTGSLPPMDYVAPDGSFAGFNTAICAEIGKRTGKNIELIQVDSLGRAAALSSGKVDAVFWTAGMHEDNTAENKEKFDKNATEEQKKLMYSDIGVSRDKRVNKDRPDGTVITRPYYSDQFNIVGKKK